MGVSNREFSGEMYFLITLIQQNLQEIRIMSVLLEMS